MTREDTRRVPSGSRTDDRAVSSVVAVVLMIAITVVLAGVIAGFAMSSGEKAETSPSASLSISADSAADQFVIGHDGGDSLENGRTRIVIVNESSGNQFTIGTGSASDPFSVGEEIVITVASGDVRVHSSSDVWTGRPTAGAAMDGQDIGPGLRYTIRIIDTETQQIIAESVLTA